MELEYKMGLGWENNMSKYLGRKFYQNLQNSVDKNKINSLLRRVENLKLEIIDAAENGQSLPKFDDIGWLYKTQTEDGGLNYSIWNDFTKWLSNNGLSYEVKADYKFGYGDEYLVYKLELRLSSWISYADVLEPDTISWMQNMKDKWELAKNPTVMKHSNVSDKDEFNRITYQNKYNKYYYSIDYDIIKKFINDGNI
jgi:hypothetical protein